LEERRSVGTSSCNSHRRNGSKSPILDVYDDDDGNSFFNHDQQQISCSVHGSKIVNYHNAVVEDIPFI